MQHEQQQLLTKASIALAQTEPDAVVISPCISVCRMSPDRSHCEGCFRSIDEIRAWSRANAQERQAIWRSLLQKAGLSEALVPTCRSPQA